MDRNEDYVTVESTLDPHKFLVIVMHYHKPDDTYIQTRCSQRLPRPAATTLAQSWANALGIQVR